MELKPYQKETLQELDLYLQYLQRHGNAATAFNKFWEDKLGPFDLYAGKGMEPYHDKLPGVPHVCIKIPTAGGKTFIAANAIEVIFRYFPAGLPKVVVWLVPSNAILEQTIKALSDPNHPYRQKICAHFNNRVEVLDKEELLNGLSFNPTSVREQLSILVLSFDTFRTRNKDSRRMYRENGQLMPFAQSDLLGEVYDEEDEISLMRVVRALNPLVIVDEAHGAVSALSVEMLQNLNPCFVLDLTATPRKPYNAIKFVSALELKHENMVKLPVLVYNHDDINGVIQSAINLRNKLEADAEQELNSGGKYIRPIVLFQAQSNTEENSETFQKIKEKLSSTGISPDEIKIKTATVNEIKDIDLMSPGCNVRYIITINALKEGWDCPFAYILASLADRSSSTDVEQILGRVLRQPYVRQHQNEMLNNSYVLTASAKFLDTLGNLVEGLNRAGFGEEDCKVVEPESPQELALADTAIDQQLSLISEAQALDAIDEIKPDQIHIGTITPQAENVISALQKQALLAKQHLNAAIDRMQAGENIQPPEIASKVHTYYMRDEFAESAKRIMIPMFFTRLNPGIFLLDGIKHEVLSRSLLLSEFRLSNENCTINFQEQEANLYQIDLERTRGEESIFAFKKLSGPSAQVFVNYLLSQPKEIQVSQMAGKFAKNLARPNWYIEKDINRFVTRILENLSISQLEYVIRNELPCQEMIKKKIESLAEIFAENAFNEQVISRQITVMEQYQLGPKIEPQTLAPPITRSLYQRENGINPFETRLIDTIANLPNVEFWHRNMDRRGFMLNGFINHYPDFIVLLKSGRLILIETKGDHLDGDLTKAKIRLGRTWSNLAGDKYEYFMLFEHKHVDGAYTLDEVIKHISRL